jgi:hypothetical protein
MGEDEKLATQPQSMEPLQGEGSKIRIRELPNDGFVGMSSDVQVTLHWVTNYIEETEGTTTIYRIAQGRILLARADVLRKRTYFFSCCLITAMGIILTCGFPDNLLMPKANMLPSPRSLKSRLWASSRRSSCARARSRTPNGLIIPISIEPNSEANLTIPTICGSRSKGFYATRWFSKGRREMEREALEQCYSCELRLEKAQHLR